MASSTLAAATTLLFVVGHEVLYHLTGGSDFPVGLLRVDDSEWLKISHGGLDSLGIGLLIVLVLLAQERRIVSRLVDGSR